MRAGDIGGAAPAGGTPAERLRWASKEMEAVFLRQLFEVMRSSQVEEDGLLGRSEGEELFQSLLDDRMASEAAHRLQRGLGEALYRQLSRRLGTEGE